MCFTEWKRERFIRRVLRRLSRQRVAIVVQPGNVLVIERAVTDNDNVAEALRTCHLRGWVNPIENAMPSGNLNPDGTLPEKGPVFTDLKPLYRLTEAGWQVINRTRAWIMATFAVALATLFATIFGICVAAALRR